MPTEPRRRSTDTDVDDLLAFFPPRIAATVQGLRKVMRRAVPQATERVRAGWRLVGYDLPVGRRSVYFAWIWPQLEHVHLGWQVGTLLDDPEHLLGGAELKLKKVRYLTFEPGEKIDPSAAIAFSGQAAAIVGSLAGRSRRAR